MIADALALVKLNLEFEARIAAGGGNIKSSPISSAVGRTETAAAAESELAIALVPLTVAGLLDADADAELTVVVAGAVPVAAGNPVAETLVLEHADEDADNTAGIGKFNNVAAAAGAAVVMEVATVADPDAEEDEDDDEVQLEVVDVTAALVASD